MFAFLGMYPFDTIASAYEELWQLLSRRVGWLPPELSPFDEDAWPNEDMALSQTCGWPLVTSLSGRVRPIGSFHLAVPSASGWMHRSMIVGANPLVESGLRAAVNTDNSLSGWISLLRYAGVTTWPGEIIWTGSHAESYAAVADGRADTAAIDSLSMEFMRREGTIGSIHVVGEGPLIPALPLITSNSTSENKLAELRAALASIVADPENVELMSALMIAGFSPLDLTDYVEAIGVGDDLGKRRE